MERDVGPLEGDKMRRRKGTTTTTTTTMMGSGGGSRDVLFGNRGGGGSSSYAPPSNGDDADGRRIGSLLDVCHPRFEDGGIGAIASRDAGIMRRILTDREFNARDHGTAEGTDREGGGIDRAFDREYTTVKAVHEGYVSSGPGEFFFDAIHRRCVSKGRYFTGGPSFSIAFIIIFFVEILSDGFLLNHLFIVQIPR